MAIINVELIACELSEACIEGWLAWESDEQPPEMFVFDLSGRQIDHYVSFVDRSDVSHHYLLNDGEAYAAKGFFITIRAATHEQQSLLLASEEYVCPVSLHGADINPSILEHVRVHKERYRAFYASDGVSLLPALLLALVERDEGARQGSTARALEKHVDLSCYSNGTCSLEGWLAYYGDPEFKFVFQSESEFALAPPHIVFQRPDVKSHFEASGKRGLSCEGFHVVADGLKMKPSMLWIFDQGSFYSQEIPAENSTNAIEAATRIISRESLQTKDHLSIISRLVDADFPIRKGLSEKRIRSFGATYDCELSFIIPVFGRWDFLRYLWFMFQGLVDRLPKFEVVFVIDDPSIEVAIDRYFSQLKSFKFTLKIIFSRSNQGFAKSINSGANEASADTIVLMNSDVYIENPKSLLVGYEIVKQPTTAIVGFMLLFENGSIQHDGMELSLDYTFMGVPMPCHPGKGLPAVDGADEIVSVECDLVTGALMMVERETFLKLGGMPELFTVGDFEDVLLCQKAKSLGKNILVRGRGLYHLERQSFPQSASSDVRQAILARNVFRYLQEVADG